jgi:thiol-disulfide isomerase/thioredoxin
MKTVLLFGVMAATLAAQQNLTPVNETSYPKVVAAQKGKVVLVNFWATWCKPCRVEMPQLSQLTQKLRGKGFELVTISSDEPKQEATALKVLKDEGLTGPAYIKKVSDDDQFTNSVHLGWFGTLPAAFLYDRNGKEVGVFVGETPFKNIEAAIQKLL